MRRLLLALLTVIPAWACSCFNSATPCSVLGGSSVIFVAEVIVDSGEGWGKGPAKVMIVEPLQNVPAGLKEATIDTASGTSCYSRLHAGERYVIITDGPRYSVGGCTASFPLRGNEHILDAMRNRLKGGSPRLTGTVRKSTSSYSHEGGIANVSIQLKGDKSLHTTTTDGEGHYVLPGLEPGRYQIRISRDGFVPDDEYNHRQKGRPAWYPETKVSEPAKAAPGEIVIGANSCEIRDLALWPAGSLRGTVRGVDGKPIGEVPVQAFGLDQRGRRESSPLRTASTSADGSYTLKPLPAGQYVVGINANPYHDESPYPPTLYANGQTVQLGEGNSVEGIDLTAPAPRTPAQLRIRVLSPDGRPHQGAKVRLETPAGEQRWSSPEVTDANGEVLAPAYSGERYTVEVFHYFMNPENGRLLALEGSAPVEVTSRRSTVTVVLRAPK